MLQMASRQKNPKNKVNVKTVTTRNQYLKGLLRSTFKRKK